MGWNDAASSFKIGSNIRVTLCDNAACGGNWNNVLDIVGPIVVGDMGNWNDIISEVLTYPYN
jgi:hypothetical protein